jgi:hypothetical protein
MKRIVIDLPITSEKKYGQKRLKVTCRESADYNPRTSAQGLYSLLEYFPPETLRELSKIPEFKKMYEHILRCVDGR